MADPINTSGISTDSTHSLTDSNVTTTTTAGNDLTLHLDVNGTITPIDSVDKGNPDHLIHMFLAKNTYGTPDIHGQWQLHEGEKYHSPQVQADGTLSLNYSTWLRRKLTPVHYRESMTYNFAEKGQPGERIAFLVDILRHYYTDMNGGKPLIGPLFPSAVRLLQRYPCAKIVLRTFGHDAPLIVSAVKQVTEQHPLGRMKHKYFIGFRLSRKEQKDGVFVLTHVPPTTDEGIAAESSVFHDSGIIIPPIISGTVVELGEFIDSLPCDCFILDDYQYWTARRRAKEHGK
jgi:hypothetical protein